MATETLTNRKLIFLGMVVVLLLVALIWANYHYLSVPLDYTGRDFMSVYSIGRAVIEDLNPYDDAVWIPLRARYGSEWFPSQRASWPLNVGVLFTPLAMLHVDVAAAIWLTINELTLVASPLLLIVAYRDLKPSLWEIAIVLVGMLLSRWFFLNLFHGQITGIVVFILTTFLFLEKVGKHFWAGAILSLILLKPNPFILFVPMLGIWLLTRHRWHIIIGGFSGVAVQLLGTLIVQPNWIRSYFWVSEKTSRAPSHMPTVWGFSRMLVDRYWPILGLILLILIAAGLSYLVLKRRDFDLGHVVAIAVTASVMTTPYAWAYEHTYLIPVVSFIFVLLYQRMGSGAAVAGWLLLVTIFPWALHNLIAVPVNIDSLNLFIPILIGGTYLALILMDRKHPQPEPASA